MDEISMASHPFISTILTLYTLLFLYFPVLIYSPVIFSTSVILLSLLRLGASQKKNKKPQPRYNNHNNNPSLQTSRENFTYLNNFSSSENDNAFDSDPKPDQVSDCSSCKNEPAFDTCPKPDPVSDTEDRSSCKNDSAFDTCPKPDSCSVKFNGEDEPVTDTWRSHGGCFVEWNVRAPLEVIHEAYEEDEEGENNTEDKREEELRVIQRYASLSLYYPETDTDTSSLSEDDDFPVIGDWDSPDNLSFRWDDVEEREELIEIELDCKRNNGNCNNVEVDEENLIEIDLSLPN